MSVLATLALAASVASLPECPWDTRPQSAYTGDVVAALNHYADIPGPVREALKLRLQTHRYDELVRIDRRGIHGAHKYSPELRDVHFAKTLCAKVSLAQWSEQQMALGMVYCEADYCVLVPTEGRHVSRVTRPLPANLAEALTEMAQHPPGAGPAQDSFAKGRILVMTRAGLSEKELARILGPHGGKGRRLGRSDIFIVDLPAQASETAVSTLLAKHPQLKFAELDRRIAPALVTNDPYLGSQWHLSKIGAAAAWDGSQGNGTTIAVLDTGVDGTHPDLTARMVAGWNFYDNNADASDPVGHGTAVAGAAAASSNNAVGVAGVAGLARIMPVRISDPSGYAYWSTVAQGLTWAADQGAKVANISFNGVASSLAVQNAAQYMKNKGGLVVVAAGNNGIDENLTPTSTMIVVSATGQNDLRTSWSSYGGFVTLAAPGQDIWTTTKGGGYQAWWGTSLASPVVAGVVAQMLSAKPTLSNLQQEGLLYASATDLGTAGRDPYYGHGRVNAAAAVQASLAASPPADTQAPSASITSPSGGATVSAWVAVNASATDNVGVARVELRVNGSTVATDSSAPYGFSWDSTTVPNGMVNLVAQAFDAAGNSAGSATIAVNVANGVAIVADVTPPVLNLSNPTNGAKLSGNTVSVTVNATDNSGAAGISQTLYIDGAQVASGSGGSLSYNWNIRKAAAGAHTIKAVAKDAASNTATQSISVTK
ncbi:MHFG family PEP-CTERM protein [Roseateles toxinivorans]|uniref:Subtilisin family serine protease n=1 Tax=Roseateles toxinivorans TaxID=270368 RepID=A0A4R6QPJ4_9BURK|nr:MHFG family PEP-CTERM protein [Roseateles toxinivorans]TDP71558.1 subtilisin family serine protease [Roseateles toxinivorans]